MTIKKKINWKHLSIASACVIAPTLAFTISCSSRSNSKDTSIFRLQFNDVNNIGKNTAKSHFDDAKPTGSGFKVEEEHKDSHALKFEGGSKGTNYLTLPAQTLSNSETTIAMWLKMPKADAIETKTTLFGMSFDEGRYFYVSPYETDSWNGFGIHAKFGAESEVNLTDVDASEKVYGRETPLGGILQPIFDTWQLLGFSFTSNNLKVFQNGKEVLSYDGDYSLNHHKITSFKFGSANESSGEDFKGSLSDIRIYDRVLDQYDYQKEFETSYLDYKTIDMDFNEGNLNDSVRGYDGDILSTARKNVIFEEKDGRKVAYLNGEGKEGDDSRSGFYLPRGALTGHNELTISTNVYVEPRVSEKYLGQRLFDFSSDTNTGDEGGQRFLAFYYTMYDLNRIRVGTITDKTKLPDSGINNDPSFWITDPNFSLPIRKWMNVTTVFSKDNTKVVVNGTTVAEGENSPYYASLFFDWDNCNFFFGRPNVGGSRALHCYVDDLQIYSTALTDTDIQDVMGNIHTHNDKKAVENAMKNFDITQCTRDGGGRIYPESHLPDGVLATIKSNNFDVVDNEGYLLYTKEEQTCTLDVTLSRNDVSLSTTIDFTVPAVEEGKMVVDNNKFTNETYNLPESSDMSYLWRMQTSTFDWMNDLDNDKLLYMYKFTAGQFGKNYEPEKSYQSWIRPECGGEGQFQGEYIGALARVTNYTDYDRVGEIRTKLKTLLQEIAQCQKDYPTKAPYGAGQNGYLNAFTHLCYDNLAKGRGNVTKEEFHELSFNENIWVPWYMYHKQIMMCYDTITYANMSNDTETKEIKDLAKSMLYPAARWAAKKVLGFNKLEKEWSLHVEYGGMSEAMYLTYRLALEDGNEEDAKLFLRAARFFEEKFFIDALYDNSNLLSGIHVNTCIPKFNSCCAAYKVTGDRYYLQAAANAWDMMVNHMTMANGGLSSIGEHFEAPDHATQARFGEETCCSYNALRLTDYLYRFTGDAKYMHYFEKVFYNHILPSIDMVGSTKATGDWPDSDPITEYDNNQFAGKAYVMSTDFGHHITYSSPDDSFWCCVATGTESYSKLTYGNFYLDENNIMYVNMYNKIETAIPEQNGKLQISGINPGSAAKGSEYVEISAIGGGIDLTKLRFIKPSWVSSYPVITKGTETIEYELDNDYMTINTTLNAGESIRISLPMKLEVVAQRGYRGEGAQKCSYAIYYGPYMLVLDLGKQTNDIYLHNGHGSDQQGQHAYQGDITQTIRLKHHDDDNQTPFSLDESVTKALQQQEIATGAEGHAYFSGMVFRFATDNQGELTFRPFMDINYERYSFYMFYNAEL